MREGQRVLPTNEPVHDTFAVVARGLDYRRLEVLVGVGSPSGGDVLCETKCECV